MPQRSFDRDCDGYCARDGVFGGLDALLGWCILGSLTLIAPPGGDMKVQAIGVQLSSQELQRETAHQLWPSIALIQPDGHAAASVG